MKLNDMQHRDKVTKLRKPEHPPLRIRSQLRSCRKFERVKEMKGGDALAGPTSEFPKAWSQGVPPESL